MNAIEKRICDLSTYNPDLTAEPDLSEFWDRVLEEVHGDEYGSERRDKGVSLKGVTAYDVKYSGYAGTTINGLFMRADAGIDGRPAPCIIIFPAYSNGKGDPDAYAHWLCKGISVFAVDVRGRGMTGNTLGSSHGMTKGWVTEGLLDLERCYYKAVAIDTLRALRWAFEQPDIDETRIGAVGGSQGGGLALLAAAFEPRLRLTVADIPSLCHMDYGVLHSTGSLTEVADFCRRHSAHTATALKHLSYFDMLNLAERIRTPILVSVGLKDTICMPETIFPVFARIASQEKQLEIYPFSGHVIETEQRRKTADFMNRFFA